MKKCPYCAEDIQDEAIKCKHCGSMLNKPPPRKKGSNTALWVIGSLVVLACLIIWGAYSFFERADHVAVCERACSTYQEQVTKLHCIDRCLQGAPIAPPTAVPTHRAEPAASEGPGDRENKGGGGAGRAGEEWGDSDHMGECDQKCLDVEDPMKRSKCIDTCERRRK